MAETYYVKCEECGRRLRGPQRNCDVCGGKMTRKAEESYYTPEGIIRKGYYSRSAKRTPDGTYKQSKKSSGTRFSKKNTSSGAGSAASSGTPIIDRVGDAVDILAGAEEMSMESLKKMGEALTGNKSEWKNLSGDGTEEKQNKSKYSFDNQKKKTLLSYGIGLIIFVIGVFSFAMDAANDSYDYDDDYGYEDEYYEGTDPYEMITPAETVVGDGYTLYFEEILIEGDDDQINRMDAYISLEVEGDDMNIHPFSSMEILFDNVDSGVLDYVNVISANSDEDIIFYDSEETTVLTSGEKYTFIMSYTSVPDWSELKLLHNFKGSISERDTTTDITVVR